MSLSENDVRTVAALVKVDVPDAEMRRLATDLSRIVDFFDALAAAETRGIEPMAHPLDLTARLRDDAAVTVTNTDALRALAPSVGDGLYRVPKVIDG